MSQVDHTKAARSVHLVFPAPEGDLFYNEMVIEQSQMGSYFCVMGFNHGYFGMQEREDGKWIIFSIWDPGNQDDPNSVSDEKRVRLLYKDKDLVTGRFGNEGTGGQSFYKYDWKIGERYKFKVETKVVENRTAFTAYFYHNQRSEWIKLVTFDTLANGDNLKGYYSFVEDFRRDGKSIEEVRKASYGNGWVRSLDGDWVALRRAKFSADQNVWENIDAGVDGDDFYLITGGDTKMETPLWDMMKLNPPIDMP